jgi:glycosyltransferase involved in cell wall biosynthesis
VAGPLIHLIDTGGPGGAETVYARLVTGLAERGWPGIPVVSREGWLAETLRAAGEAPVILSSRGSFQWRLARELVRRARRHGVCAIVTHLYGSAIYGSAAGLLTRRPVVGVFHGQSDVSSPGRFDRAKRALVRLGLTTAIAVSDRLRQELDARLSLPSGRWRVIPNGIEVERFTGASPLGLRSQLGLSDGDILIGALGNVRRPKGYADLLRAAAILQGGPLPVHVVVAGEGQGELMDELLALRHELGLATRVHFLGLVGVAPSFLAELDLFVSSSTSEGFSIACVEAMAAGLAVVATRSGGPEEIVVPGETGLLVPTSNPEALAAALEQVVANPSLRHRMGAAGRARARAAYSLAAMLDAYEDLLNEVTAAAG